MKHFLWLASILLTLSFCTAPKGLVLERRRHAGWATTALALLLIPLVIYLPFVPGLASDLTRSLGNPALYAGPAGWLSGCRAATMTPRPVEVTREVAIQVTAAPTGVPVMATPTPMPTPAEPFPLRQIFPETLYWNAEALTDENGFLALDLPLADTVTTWRLTALASTQAGDLGFATADIVVFQDFFVELDLPEKARQGETITVTIMLYNYLEQPQTVRIEPVSAEWYTLETPPPTLDLPPNGVAPALFAIRIKQIGRFPLQINIIGEHLSDSIAREMTVMP